MKNTLLSLLRYLSPLLDLILPPRCAACGDITTKADHLCGPCWTSITFITHPYCATCGLPFDIDVGPDMVCASCIQDPPLFQKARGVFLYKDTSKQLIFKLKHGDQTHLARMFAEWMVTYGQDVLPETDVLIPVPIHWTRLLNRLYNQAGLLSARIADLTSLPIDYHSLKRSTATPSQGTKSKKDRWENVKKAFIVADKEKIKGKGVLLVDDVMTSGATVKACTRALLKAGAKHVNVLTLGRVQ